MFENLLNGRAYLFIISLWLLAPNTSMASDVKLTKEELLAGVETVRSLIIDLQVTATAVATDLSASNPDGFVRQTVIIRGLSAYIDDENGDPSDPKQQKFRRKKAFNGTRSSIFNVSNGTAVIMDDSRSRETESQDTYFFDLNLLNRPQGIPAGDMSLVSLLASPDAKVRDASERASGRLCHVVDLSQSNTQKKLQTIWIDVEHGFVPARHVYYTANDQILMDYTAEEIAEVAPKLWLIVRGRKKVHPVLEGIASAEYIIQVEGWPKDKSGIKVNSGVDPLIFDLWKRFPPGTLVLNATAKTSYTVTGKDYEAIAKGAEEAKQLYTIAGPNDDSLPAGSFRRFFVPLLIIGLVILFGIIFYVLSKRLKAGKSEAR